MDWYYEAGGQQRGPTAHAEIERMLASRELAWDARVWHGGLDGWTPAREVPELGAARPGAPASTWHDTGRLARVVVVLLAFAALADLAAFGSGVAQLVILNGLAGGTQYADETLALNDAVFGGLGVLQTALLVVTAIAFLRWFRRSYVNLAALGAEHLQSTPGWAVGGWFVPFLNLVRPYRIAKEIWTVSHQAAAADELLDAAPVSHNRVSLWWGLFLVSSMVSNAGARMLLRAEEVPELTSATTVLGVSDLLSFFAALACAWMVAGVARAQSAAAARRGFLHQW